MKSIWIFKDGYTTRIECTSFPYAFRLMYNTIKNGVKNGKSNIELTKNMSIVSPIKDIHGDYRIYYYDDAVRMATNSGLLSADGQLNSKEFKLKK